MPYRIFNLDETARYLHLDRADVERLVKNQDIPFERHGVRLAFRKIDLDAWASPRILGLEGRRLSEYHRKTSRSVLPLAPDAAILSGLVRPEYIQPALPAKTKASAIREMAALAESTGKVLDPKALLNGLEARESLCSTGLPGGLALLHARNPETYLFESAFLVLGRTAHPIPFGAPDGRATDLFFLLACTDSSFHLHTLARVCLLAQKTQLLDDLRQAPGRDAMFQCLVAAENGILSEGPLASP